MNSSISHSPALKSVKKTKTVRLTNEDSVGGDREEMIHDNLRSFNDIDTTFLAHHPCY